MPAQQLECLIYAPVSSGGLAEYAHEQAAALVRAGVRVEMLAGPGYLAGRRYEEYPVVRDLTEAKAGASRSRQALRILGNWGRLFFCILKRRPQWVLLQSYSEYLSLIWVWPHALLAWLGVVKYAAVLHDPVRDYVVGPNWWHWLSVRLAYLPISVGIVHGPIPKAASVPVRIRMVEVPHGFYGVSGNISVSESNADLERRAAALRTQWGVPPGARVFLAFGYVRDNKNLSLFLEAMRAHPNVFLVITGQSPSRRDRPMSAYRDRAAELGLGERVVVEERFIPDEEVGAYFNAADFALVTYNAAFHSQSGVLHVAARGRRPVLASSGAGPLRASVEKYGLGVFVEPDSAAAVEEGLQTLLQGRAPAPQWEQYAQAASWEVNAARTAKALGLSSGTSSEEAS